MPSQHNLLNINFFQNYIRENLKNKINTDFGLLTALGIFYISMVKLEKDSLQINNKLLKNKYSLIENTFLEKKTLPFDHFRAREFFKDSIEIR